MRSAMRWIANHVSTSSALKWQARASAAITKVLKNPTRHRLAHEADRLGIDLREALFGRKPNIYRILFSIDGNTVIIHYVRHAARDWVGESDV
jgi:plasmid stabilization system protein ParE